jgi:hypothetical protein
MSANSARRRRTIARRQATKQWIDQPVAELDTPCPLHDLTHPQRRQAVFRAGVKIVLKIEEPKEPGVCRLIDHGEQLTPEEGVLSMEKAVECLRRRETGRCALLNQVQISEG